MKPTEIAIFLIAIVALWWFLYRFFLFIGTTVSSWKETSVNEFEHIGLDDGPPPAQQAVTPSYQTLQSVFSFKGILGRKAFLLTQLLNAVCMMVGFVIATGMTETSEGEFSASGLYIVVVVLVAGLWISWAASTKRTRDTGVNVWWVLALLVPPLNLAAMVFLFLVPTDEFKGRGL